MSEAPSPPKSPAPPKPELVDLADLVRRAAMGKSEIRELEKQVRTRLRTSAMGPVEKKAYRQTHPNVHRCMVTIRRSGSTDARFVKCLEDPAGYILVIPIEGYLLRGAGDRRELLLRVPDHWLTPASHARYDLYCRETIDLDKYDDGPWPQSSPPPEKG